MIQSSDIYDIFKVINTISFSQILCFDLLCFVDSDLLFLNEGINDDGEEIHII